MIVGLSLVIARTILRLVVRNGKHFARIAAFCISTLSVIYMVMYAIIISGKKKLLPA